MSDAAAAKVISVEISETWGRATATGTLADGSQAHLFSWYVDELRFSKDELIGLTVDEARALFHKRDVAYLQS